MIYPSNFEDKIGFTRVRELIKQQCLSNLGKERVDQMRFVTLHDVINRWVNQVNEFKNICEEDSNFPTSYYIDVREPLKRIKVEGLFLDERELFNLQRSLLSVKDIVMFFNLKHEQNRYPYLYEITKKVNVYPYIFDRINSILNKFGKVKDSASEELSKIRYELIKKQGSISKRMNAILGHARSEGLVDADATVVIRDGRAVIPVPAGNKRKLGGIVHDESATGKTSFIEPAEIVEINNEIRELEYAERREVTRILIAFADSIRPYIDDLIYSYEFLGIIDFIRAKARFAISINACLPHLKDSPTLEWNTAMHPLLFLHHSAEGKEVVPLDIALNSEQRIVLISGPNAGGKSVCLQTVGLLQYMWQCGLLLPLEESSIVGIYKNIFIDIGDQQSIENDLSTYSSHLNNMKIFIKNANKKSLVLIDEFGTGTEPALGGAIAQSVLHEFVDMKIQGVITTHYTNLKHFASSTDGVVNGAMQFDTHKIKPMFKLLIGQPGSSFAFETARKIGLPENLLKRAQAEIGENHINFDKHLREIVRDKRYWEQKRNNIRKKDKQLDDVYDKYLNLLEKMKSQREDIIKSAKEEADKILSTANKRIEGTIRKIKENNAEKERTKKIRAEFDRFKEQALQNSKDEDKINKEIEKIKRRKERKKEQALNDNDLNSSVKNNKQKKSAPQKSVVDDLTIKQGDNVLLKGQSQPGEVMNVNGDNAMVAFGNLITNVKIHRLEKVSKNKAKKVLRSGNWQSTGASTAERIRKRKLNFKPDIDVRGQRAEEAIDTITSHLDDAIMCEVSEVKILHGKGNGILRQLIREMLATMPYVKSFRDEHIQYGGSGITIVEL